MIDFFENWYYTVSPPKIIPKQSSILKTLDKTIIEEKNKNFNIFFCWQIRDEKLEISNYNYISLRIPENEKYDFNLIEQIRWIKHNLIVDWKYLIFIFDKYISDKKIYDNYWELLEFIYTKSKVAHFIPYKWTISYPDCNVINTKIVNKEHISLIKLWLLYEFLIRYKNQSIFNQDTTKDNIWKIKEYLKYIWIESIFKKLWIVYDVKTMSIQWIDWWKVDIEKNIVVDTENKWNPCWSPFFFVLFHKNMRLDETLEWFNNNYNTTFKLDNDERHVLKTSYNSEWTIITKWWWFILIWNSYIATGEKAIPITNFYIKVFYVIENSNWTKEYIIELYNDLWEHTQQMARNLTFSTTKFKEYLSKYWWYVFYWKDTDISNMLKEIARVDIPRIKNVLWLWFHWDKLLLSNWIFNLKTKKLTIWEKWDKFLFDDENKGYQISSNIGKPFFEMYKPENIHQFNTVNKVSSADDIWKLFESMYKWDVWLLALMYIYGQIAYWVFKDYNGSIKYPILLTYWITSSWKTELVEILARVYWISWQLNNFNWVSAFMFLSLISSFQWIPVFFSEYREKWIKDIESKKNKIRNLFDREWEWKWKADQSVVMYKYTANLAIEWEETISDPATRSRSILIHMSKKYKLDNVLDFKEMSHSKEIENLLYTYLRWFEFDYVKYDTYFKEWLTNFKSSETRISENFARIYAWCMIFDKTKSDEYLKVLKRHFELHTKDQNECQWAMSFFKALAMNINNIYSFSDDDKPFFVEDTTKQQYPHFFLKIPKIQEYFRTKNVKLEHEFWTYLTYMADIWYDYWLHEVQWEMVYAIKIPLTKDIPKELLVIKEVYTEYKKLIDKKLI